MQSYPAVTLTKAGKRNGPFAPKPTKTAPIPSSNPCRKRVFKLFGGDQFQENPGFPRKTKDVPILPPPMTEHSFGDPGAPVVSGANPPTVPAPRLIGGAQRLRAEEDATTLRSSPALSRFAASLVSQPFETMASCWWCPLKRPPRLENPTREMEGSLHQRKLCTSGS